MNDFKFVNTCVAVLVATSFTAARGQSIEAPPLKSGDSWVYKVTEERAPNGWVQNRYEVAVERATSSAIYFSTKQAGSSQAPREIVGGLDWSRIRDVNGKETVVNRPLSFPLTVGKSWETQYTELNPNRAHKSEQWNIKYTVVGYETVAVPAGTFKAMKIEAEGHWNAEIAPGQSVVQGAQTSQNSTTLVTKVETATDKPVSGRIYKAFWYVPEAHRWVKSVEELYGSGGVRSERTTAELESFKVGD